MQICLWEKRFLANIYLLYRHFSKLVEKLDNREKRHDNSINKRTDLIMTLRDYETNFPFYLSLSKDEITSIPRNTAALLMIRPHVRDLSCKFQVAFSFVVHALK